MSDARSTIDIDTLNALDAFRTRLQSRFGSRFRGMMLFGSRARGDHRPDSDADVAVFLEAIADPVAAQMDIADDSYAVFLSHELLIQPWVFLGTPEHPDRSHGARLLVTVRAEGVKF
jgi:predicted nucleotidyltransferase